MKLRNLLLCFLPGGYTHISIGSADRRDCKSLFGFYSWLCFMFLLCSFVHSVFMRADKCLLLHPLFCCILKCGTSRLMHNGCYIYWSIKLTLLLQWCFCYCHRLKNYSFFCIYYCPFVLVPSCSIYYSLYCSFSPLFIVSSLMLIKLVFTL